METFCRVCFCFYEKCNLFDGRLCSEYFDKIAGLPPSSATENSYVCPVCYHRMRKGLRFRDVVRLSHGIFAQFYGPFKDGDAQVTTKRPMIEGIVLDMKLSMSEIQYTEIYGADDPAGNLPDEGSFEFDPLKDTSVDQPTVEREPSCDRVDGEDFYCNDVGNLQNDNVDGRPRGESPSDRSLSLGSWTRKRDRKSAKRKKPNVSRDNWTDDGKCTLVLLSRDEQIAEMMSQAERKSYRFAAHKCDKCYTSFTHEKYYRQHVPKHEKKTDFYCDICQSYFLTVHKLHMHTNVVHVKRYQCSLCDCRLKDRSLVVEHYNLAHMGIKDNLKCDVCGKSFSKLSTLKRHLCKQDKVKCEECGKMVTKLSLRSHKITHVAREKRYECSLCPGRFLSTSILKAHEKLKHSTDRGKESYYCIECDLTFKSEEILKRHLTEASRHTTEENLKQCPHCPARLPKWGVTTHVNKVHLNVRPHRCDLCPKAFFNRNSMVLHRRTTHEGVRTERKYLCETCGMAFVNKRVLTDHRNMHTGLRPYQCKVCNADFTHEAARYNHVQLVHLRIKKATKRTKKDAPTERETAPRE